MDIQIIDIRRTEHGVYYEMASGKTSMIIGYTAHGNVYTLVQNASNRAWGKLGRTFAGSLAWVEALAAYKSGACKAMIEHVRDAEVKATAAA